LDNLAFVLLLKRLLEQGVNEDVEDLAGAQVQVMESIDPDKADPGLRIDLADGTRFSVLVTKLSQSLHRGD
jgi:hypothetical protein